MLQQLFRFPTLFSSNFGVTLTRNTLLSAVFIHFRYAVKEHLVYISTHTLYLLTPTHARTHTYTQSLLTM